MSKSVLHLFIKFNLNSNQVTTHTKIIK